MRKTGLTLICTLAAGAAAFAAPPATAQEQAQAPIPVPPQAPDAGAVSDTVLATVTVTATKRRQSEREVAGAVTALTGQQLREVGASNFSDYLTLAPGVQFDQSDPGYSVVSIRGVTTTNDVQQNQTPVGIFFDEVPLTDPFGSIAIPDIDAFDVAQVEVMRGPQGALFGSGALGGAINYVPQRPDLSAYQADVQTDTHVGHDRQLGGFGKIMLNAPILHDTLGVRVVGFLRHEPGYIDNLGVNRQDSNNQELSGGRAMATWKLLPGTTLSFTGLYQRTHIADQDDSFSGLGTLQKNTAFREAADERLDLGDFRLESDLGFARLVAIGAYQYKSIQFRQDGSYAIAALSTGANSNSGNIITQLIDDIGPLATQAHGNLHGYTSEIRLVSPDYPHFQWLAGAFYADRHEWEHEGQALLGLSTLTTPIANLVDQLLGPAFAQQYGSALLPGGYIADTIATIKARELAGYADVSYKLGDWKLDAGGRFFDNQINTLGDNDGVLEAASLLTQGATPTFNEVIGGKEVGVGFNPKVSLSYTPTRDLLFYTLYSRGFSLGGVNIVPAQSGFSIPPSYGSNKLYNLEVGAKTSWWHHRLQIDLTPYTIYWSNIPLELVSPTGSPYLANVGNAHNYGVESSIVVQPVKRLTVTNSLTWAQARLGNPYLAGGSSVEGNLEGAILPVYKSQQVPAGTQLPGAARWQNATIVAYKWPGDGVQYHAVFVNRFIDTAPSSIQYYNIPQGGYDVMGLRGGWDWGDFQAELFVNNLTDRRGVATRSYIASSLIVSHVIEPRTIGIQFTWSPN